MWTVLLLLGALGGPVVELETKLPRNSRRPNRLPSMSSLEGAARRTTSVAAWFRGEHAMSRAAAPNRRPTDRPRRTARFHSADATGVGGGAAVHATGACNRCDRARSEGKRTPC